MSERKVLNKYFPPNFDPSQIPRQKKPKDLQHKVRLMAPFSMRCNTCGEYIYKGKKFNARKETVEGESYLNIKIFRFYIRCTRCSAEITFKTDPQNTDYVAENGVSRNFEPWRDEGAESEEQRRQQEEEEEYDPMKALENRTEDSKREMDILDALDEIRTRNARSERVDVDDVMGKLSTEDQGVVKQALNEDDLEDERLAASIFTSASGQKVRKLNDGDLQPDAVALLADSELVKNMPSFKTPLVAKKRKAEDTNSLGITVKKKTVNKDPVVVVTPKSNGDKQSKSTPISSVANGKAPANGLGMLANYSDSESDSD
ncbi:CWC16 protein [Umbelopsis sp. AD052]|nr:CWC16 protein [Umbelopsis sp. AD052]